LYTLKTKKGNQGGRKSVVQVEQYQQNAVTGLGDDQLVNGTFCQRGFEAYSKPLKYKLHVELTGELGSNAEASTDARSNAEASTDARSNAEASTDARSNAEASTDDLGLTDASKYVDKSFHMSSRMNPADANGLS
jgi:hypothetical protein